MARTRQAEPTIYVATVAGFLRVDGEEYTLRPGKTRVREGHPLLRAYPDCFEPTSLDYDIEQMTAAPGERRE